MGYFVKFHVGVEAVVPGLAGARARLQLAQIQPVGSYAAEHGGQTARRVRGAKIERGFIGQGVNLGRFGALQHQETGVVVRVVVNGGG